MPVLLHRLDAGLPVPAYAHPGDAGADLYARTDVTLAARRARARGDRRRDRAALPAMPRFVHPRSGLAARHGVTTLNAPGTVDAGYRGEIHVNLLNTDRSEAFTVRRGDRIAQLVIQEVSRARFLEVESLPGSQRGDTGHGASGGFGAPGRPADHAQPDRLKD